MSQDIFKQIQSNNQTSDENRIISIKLGFDPAVRYDSYQEQKNNSFELGGFGSSVGPLKYDDKSGTLDLGTDVSD